MPTPDTATAEEYGVSTTLANYTIESENITTAPQREQVPDQFQFTPVLRRATPPAARHAYTMTFQFTPVLRRATSKKPTKKP